MRENGIAVRQQDGLRIGFVVADDAGYAFNLPPLLVEDVTEMSRTFNAITLEPGQIAQTLHSLRPSTSANGAGTRFALLDEFKASPVVQPRMLRAAD